MIKLSELLDGVEGTYDTRGSDTDNINIENITSDSRSESPNCLFIAIEGTVNDGHDYISGLPDNFIAVLGSRANADTALPYIRTNNPRKILALLSHKIKNNPSDHLINIGVTGTNGKTTVSYIIHYLLGKLNHKSALIGTTGIYIGDKLIPATHTTPSAEKLAELYSSLKEEKLTHSVIEVSSHALHQHRVTGISFRTAIFTNLTQDHLDYHGTMKDYADAKKILFDNLKSESSAIFYSGDGWVKHMARDTKAENINVGFDKSDDYYLSDIKIDINGTRFKISIDTNEYTISTQLIGKFNMINVALSIAALVGDKYNINEIIRHIGDFRGVPGRMEVFNIQGAKAIVDYAHTPDALENALRTLSEIEGRGRIITVFGCGGDRDKTKRPLMGAVAEKYSDKIIITNDNPRTEDPESIASDIVDGIKLNNHQIILDREQAIVNAVTQSEDNDIILIAGKGHEDYQIIGKDKNSFSDQAILRSLQ
jgi:UDP-N-acetylmuramoyl-L-alanyl-D-glutamate--2,6-diaminopimelate ligase